MSKDKIADYDGTTAGNNTDIGGISIAEGMLPSAVNNSMRELTKQLGAFANGTDPIDALTVTGAATVNGAFTSPGIDDNADSTAITIDSSENVGIGTASPSGVLHTAGSGDQTVTFQAGGESKLEMKIDGNSDGCSIRFSDSDAASQGQIRYQHSTDALIMYTNGNNERIRLLSSGGITFNGDTAAANALDDYEEGTFTPTFTGASTAGSITYVVQDGRYVKIGKQVTLWIRFQYSAFSGSAGTIRVGGFPYASESGTHAHGLSSNWLSFGNPIPSGWPIFYISGGTSHANALISKDNTSWADWASSDFHLTSGNKYFNLNIFYKTA